MPFRLRRRLCAAAVLALAASAAAVSPVSPAHAAVTVSVTANYAQTDGTLNKDRLLNVSQGGYLALQNLHILPDQAQELADLGVKQIRVDHVFDDAFYGVVQSDGVYNFDKLDEVLRPFIVKNIRPWISLSYMPSALGPSLFSPPNSYPAWGRAVAALVDHLEAEFGLTGLNWEVWNEPDHEDEFGGWWTGTHAQYNELYRASAEAVRQADPTAQVGGPGLANHIDGLLDSWLDFIAANPGLKCDFVSWHSYQPQGDFASTRDVRAELTSRGITGKKLYISEWNSDFRMALGPDSWTDTHQTASYAAHRMFEALQPSGSPPPPVPDGVFFFTGLEAWTPSQDFNGDLGMITVDGRRKAVGNTFAALTSMGTTRLADSVSSSAGTAAHALTTADPTNRRVSVLLWNDTVENASVNLTLTSLPYGTTNFAVTRSDITATAGNSRTDRAGGIVNQRPSPNERLRPSSRTVVAQAQSWSTSLTLAPNDTTLIELTPTSESVGPKPVAPVDTTVNVARDGTVSSSPQYTDTARGWSPAAVVDGRRYSIAAANNGNPTMGWSSVEYSNPSVPNGAYVQVDLGSRRSFDAVTLWPRDDQAGNGLSFPADFTIAGSLDGTNWTPLASRTGYGGGEAVHGPQTFPVQNASYRYVRVTATRLGLPVTEGGGPMYRFQLAELEVTKRAVNVAVPNPGFESGQLSGWTATGNGRVVNSGARSGKYAATFTGTGNGVITTVTGLQPNTSYTFSGYLRSNDPVHLGAKDYGGAELSAAASAATYVPTSVTFTTGPSSTSASLYAYKNSGTAQVWFDDFTLVRNP